MKLLTVTSFLISCLAYQAPALASPELDPTAPANAPQGLVVKISPDGRREVYKSNFDGVVDNSATANAVLNSALKEENKIKSVNPISELDRTSSDESWHWSWRGSLGFSYNFHFGSGFYDYYPSYSYYNSGYQYNYYYNPTYYGYRTGYHYSDPYGYHYGYGHGWHGTY
jgi:hypothetical protein